MELPARFRKADRERREDSRKVWEALGKLEEAQRRTEATLQSFLATTEKRFSEVDARLSTLETTLHAFLEATEKRFDAAERRLHGIELELDWMGGKIIESDAQKKLANYLLDHVESAELLDPKTWNRIAAVALRTGAITGEERREIGWADALVVGEAPDTRKPVCGAVEISKALDKSHVERAERRSLLLLQALRAALAAEPEKFADLLPGAPEKSFGFGIGRRIIEEGRRFAQRKGVLFVRYRNGHDRREG